MKSASPICMIDRRLKLLLVACLMSFVHMCHAELPSETVAQLATVRAACIELGLVVDALEAHGRGQYSRMSYEVVRSTLETIDKEDLPQGMTNRVVRQARELARIAPRALAEAKRIASGEEADKPVPRFKSGPVKTRGCIIYGRREWPDGCVEEDKPVMLNGWGHFWQAQRDVRLLNRMGGNFLQRDVGLRVFLPKKDVVNTNALDNFRTVADLCLAADTPLDFHLCAHYMAGWAKANSPESRHCDNHFMGFCVHDPYMVGVITDFQSRAAALTKDHPGLLAYCLTNEPGSRDVSKCRHLRTVWRDWLAARYGTVERMNDLWVANYVSFADVEMPTWPSLPKTPRGLEFVRCNRKAFADFHESLVKAVKSVAPGVPLHSKLLIDTSLGSPDTKSRYGFPFWSNDGMRFAEMFDFLDHDGVYFPEPKGKWPNRWGSHQMASDFLRSFADKPLMNTENHILPDKSEWMSVSPVHCYSALWQEAIHGLRMSAQWCWQRGTSKEPVFSGLAQSRPECLEAMGRCMLDLARLSDELVPIQSEPPTVLMMWSLSSMVLGTKHSGCYTAASFLGEPLGFVTEEFLARYLKDGVMRRPLENARVILLPGVTHLPDESVAALKRLEESGIKILAIGAELGFDDLGRPRVKTPWPSASRKAIVEKTGDDLFDGKPSDTVADIFFELKAETAFEVLSREAANWNLPHRPRLVQPVFGVETHGYEQNGVRRIALCNHLRESVEVELESDGVDLISMKHVPRKLTLPSMQPVFVEFSTNQPLKGSTK